MCGYSGGFFICQWMYVCGTTVTVGFFFVEDKQVASLEVCMPLYLINGFFCLQFNLGFIITRLGSDLFIVDQVYGLCI